MSLRAYTFPLILAACNLVPYDQTTGATRATAHDATTTGGQPATASSTSSTTAPTGASGVTTAVATTGTTALDFVMMPDCPCGAVDCDIWIDDCPQGQKCMPASLDGDGSWESLICAPIVPDPDGIGEPCTVVGTGASGEDTCDEHVMCVNVDPDTGMGTCVAMCIGSEAAPACADPDANCWIAQAGIPMLCFPQCDPVGQDCDPTWACLAHGPDFACSPDYSGDEGQLFDPCDFPEKCDPGLHCAAPELALECGPMAAGCCLSFCDTDEPNQCPGPDHECLPFYDDPAEAASFNADVGLCQLPAP